MWNLWGEKVSDKNDHLKMKNIQEIPGKPKHIKKQNKSTLQAAYTRIYR